MLDALVVYLLDTRLTLVGHLSESIIEILVNQHVPNQTPTYKSNKSSLGDPRGRKHLGKVLVFVTEGCRTTFFIISTFNQDPIWSGPNFLLKSIVFVLRELKNAEF